MAIMTEFVKSQGVAYRETWHGDVIKSKEDACAPFDKSFVVIPRRYVGSRPDIQPALVVNASDAVEAKRAYYAHHNIDPSTQYTDVQVYDPKQADAPAKGNQSTRLVEQGR